MSVAIAALGDAALLIPAWLLVALALVVARRGRAALLWSAAILAAGGVTVLAKLLFHACGAEISDLDVISPSGHASFSTVFYGGLAVMMARGRPPAIRIGIGVGTCLLLALIGASRVRTGAHSAEEVAIGFLIGAVAAGAFAILYLRSRPEPVPAWPLLACFLLALVALGGRHVSLEGPIRRTARRLALSLDVCEGTAPALERYRIRLGGDVRRSGLP